jgi:hypothetical protein
MKAFLFFLVFLFPILCHAQEIIQGIVVDSASFAPLPYVNVKIKNQTKGTITDEQGNFKLVATKADTLQISYTGYNTIELALQDWVESVILLPEKVTVLNTITVKERRIDNPYEGMFDEQNAEWRAQNKKLPFYYSKSKKQNIRVGRLASENERVKTYVSIVIQNEENKNRLMKTHSLSEKEYYDVLSEFNAKYYSVMYYLTAPELISLLNTFFQQRAPKK